MLATLLWDVTAAHEEAGHGVEPAEFVLLFVAGMAIVAAVAALIFARHRAPV